MNYEELKVRASSMHRIMSYSEKGCDLTLAQMKGMITFADELDDQSFFGFRPEVTVDTMEKGIRGQSAAVSLYQKFHNQRSGRFEIFKENKDRVENEFFTGEPDFYIGNKERKCIEGFDIKCSKGIETFPRRKKELDTQYHWQGMTYIDLFGADRWTIVYCLINTPGYQFKYKQERLYELMGQPSDDEPHFERYREKEILLEKNHIFDIALFRKENPEIILENDDWSHLKEPADRIREFVIERNEADIELMRRRVEMLRKYMIQNFN